MIGEGEVPAQVGWARYVMGLDKALEKVHDEADERFNQEETPSDAGETGALLAGNQPAIETSDAAVPATDPTASRWSRDEATTTDVLDKAIDSWVAEHSDMHFAVAIESEVLAEPTAVFLTHESPVGVDLAPDLISDDADPARIPVSLWVTTLAASFLVTSIQPPRERRRPEKTEPKDEFPRRRRQGSKPA